MRLIWNYLWQIQEVEERPRIFLVSERFIKRLCVDIGSRGLQQNPFRARSLALYSLAVGRLPASVPNFQRTNHLVSKSAMLRQMKTTETIE